MSVRPVEHAIPAIRGRIQAGAPLARLAWFRVGGPAEWLVRPADADDLVALLRGLPLKQAMTVAVTCGTLSTRAAGGTAAQPTWEEATS